MRCTCGELELINTGATGVPSDHTDADGITHRAGAPCDMAPLEPVAPIEATLIEGPELAFAGWPTTAALVRPGDVLVIGFGHEITSDDADRWRRQLLAMLPGLADLVILSDGYVAAVHRPDETRPVEGVTWSGSSSVDADGR